MTLSEQRFEDAFRVGRMVYLVSETNRRVARQISGVSGAAGTVKAEKQSRIMFVGGDALEGERTIWWNLVSSSKDRIEQAKRDWKEGRFDMVPGETDFIPLPDR